MSLLSFKSKATGLMAIIAFVAFANPAFAQETNPGEQNRERSEKAQPAERKQNNRERKNDAKQGKEQDERKKRPGAESRRPMPPKEIDAAKPLQRITQLLKKLDTDGDGAISKSEAPERLIARFDTIDANGDEKIDRHDIAAMRKKLEDRTGAKPGDRPPMTDRPPGKNNKSKSNKSNNKGQKKQRERDSELFEFKSGSVEPIRPGGDG